MIKLDHVITRLAVPETTQANPFTCAVIHSETAQHWTCSHYQIQYPAQQVTNYFAHIVDANTYPPTLLSQTKRHSPTRSATMPPKRTRPSTPTTRSRTQQSTLSFHGSKAQNRITKPSATRNDTKLKKDPALFDITPGNASPDLAAPTTAEVAIAKQVQVEQVKAQREVEAQRDPLVGGDGVRVEEVLGGKAAESEVGATGGRGSGWVGDEEARARGISEAQIKKYWRGKEQERKAPRVHQEGLSLAEKVLREWDMSGQYGVSFCGLVRQLDIVGYLMDIKGNLC